MFEYKRPGWTFHAKGLWVTLPGHHSPSLTLVGSTNFGHRSVERDLEAQLCITTVSPSLRQQLHQEERCLLGWCSSVSAESLSAQTRGLRLWVRLLSPLLRHFF
ncbi:CDP-diacylglycerol--glycerol-3-phosphate 3-phosphatidyltransferase, mitochondrial-like [Petromyzon marinus]|uniref:CDP-diacylglycerol--glycerol-3-phosphate 3-phosphatidyltransferase, mitochondrial-like n=1 Tax=Petromyzon marinus TaxID=7757 RepID=UPI003F6F537F